MPYNRAPIDPAGLDGKKSYRIKIGFKIEQNNTHCNPQWKLSVVCVCIQTDTKGKHGKNLKKAEIQNADHHILGK